MSAMSVLISAGSILGRVNLVQLVVMALMEVTAFVILRTFGKKLLYVSHGAVRGRGVGRWKRRVLPPFGEDSGILKNEDRPKWRYKSVVYAKRLNIANKCLSFSKI